LEKGLYGALLVRAADELAFDGEQVLVFVDLRVDREGQIAKFGGLMDRHNGREGNVRLINGTSEPEFTIAAGQIERWRIVNASSARYIRLSLGGLPFQIIGTDGGFIEAAVTAEEVLLPPADCVELAVGLSRRKVTSSASMTCRTTAWPGRRASNASGRSASRHESLPPRACRRGCARSRRSLRGRRA
jgi:FtsP/CotA-like multicopper oxidase with cupredoxin domain